MEDGNDDVDSSPYSRENMVSRMKKQTFSQMVNDPPPSKKKEKTKNASNRKIITRKVSKSVMGQHKKQKELVVKNDASVTIKPRLDSPQTPKAYAANELKSPSHEIKGAVVSHRSRLNNNKYQGSNAAGQPQVWNDLQIEQWPDNEKIED